MKNIIKITIAFILISAPTYPQANLQDNRMGGRFMPERIEKFKKMRLIEELNFSEENAIRFNVKYTAHEEKVRDLYKKREELESDIEKMISSSQEIQKDSKELLRVLKEIEENELKIHDEKTRYIMDLKKMLTTEQMAKFYLFQRKFNKELREAIRELRHEQPRGRMRDRKE